MTERNESPSDAKRQAWIESRDNSEYGKWLDSMTPMERAELWQLAEEDECSEMDD